MLETTGMADPSPVLQTFFASTRVMKNCTIDGVITVVDCKNLMKHLRVDPGLADKEGGAKKDAKDQPINESVQQSEHRTNPPARNLALLLASACAWI